MGEHKKFYFDDNAKTFVVSDEKPGSDKWFAENPDVIPFSQVTGCGLDVDHPKMIENITKTIKICEKHEKSIGMFMDDDKVAKRWHNAGMNIYWIGTEITLLSAELQRNKKCIR